MINRGGSIDLRKVLLESVFLLSSLLLHWALPPSSADLSHHSFHIFIVVITIIIVVVLIIIITIPSDFYHHFIFVAALPTVQTSPIVHFINEIYFHQNHRHPHNFIFSSSFHLSMIISTSLSLPWHHHYNFFVATLHVVQIFPIMHFNFPLSSASSSIIIILSTFFHFDFTVINVRIIIITISYSLLPHSLLCRSFRSCISLNCIFHFPVRFLFLLMKSKNFVTSGSRAEYF